MAQRKSLSSSDSSVNLYRDAVGELKRRNEYESWVTIHRQLAIHNSFNYFLAWHRAYLYFFEKRLQDLVPGTTIPYWDWARLREIPRDFQGTGTPLIHPRTPGAIVPNLPSLQSIEGSSGLLTLTTYRSFARQLENAPHNRVHNWVGGDMANIAVSPRDPLFWCHHSHVDNLWDRWQRSHTFDGPADPGRHLNIGSERVITVREVLQISDLEYEYVATTINLAIREDDVPRGAAGTLRLVPASKFGSDNFGEAELHMEGIPLPLHHPYEIRVFLDQPDATPETPTDENPHFVGYFDAVVMGHNHDHKHGRIPGEVMADKMEVSFNIAGPLRSALAAGTATAGQGKTQTPTPVITLVPVGDAREFRFERASIVLRD